MIPNTLSDGTLKDGRVGQNFSTTVAVNENKQTFEYIVEKKIQQTGKNQWNASTISKSFVLNQPFILFVTIAFI